MENLVKLREEETPQNLKKVKISRHFKEKMYHQMKTKQKTSP